MNYRVVEELTDNTIAYCRFEYDGRSYELIYEVGGDRNSAIEALLKNEKIPGGSKRDPIPNNHI